MQRMLIDARIPVRFCETVPPAQADGALILRFGSEHPAGAAWSATRVLPGLTASAHPGSCGCCAGRVPAALTLAALFAERARGEVGFFRSLTVCVPPADAAALRRLLADDAFLQGRYVAVS